MKRNLHCPDNGADDPAGAGLWPEPRRALFGGSLAHCRPCHAGAERLREAAGHLRVQHRGQPLGSLTLSPGVAVYPEHGLTGEAVLRAADTALYRAKRDGRDRVVVAE